LQEKLFEPTEQEKILLAVDVEGFAQHGADQEFERTLEAVASLAVRLDREGCAVGLISNGMVEGGGGSVVPIGRHPQHLPSLLELLARLRRRPSAPLLDVIRAGNHLPWGISCLCFAAENSGGTTSVLDYFARHHVPVILFVSRPGNEGAPPDVRPVQGIFLEEQSG
jgi:uncharacterized protein (DUF58 family)